MDIERTLVWKAISAGELEVLAARGIEPEHFADEEVKSVYDYSLDFLTFHKQPPSPEVIHEQFPGFKGRITKDPLKYHMERFVDQVKERKATELLRDYFEVLEDKEAVKDIELHALDMAQQLAELVPAPRADRLSDGLKRKEAYDRRKREGVHPGIYLGIPTYDLLSLGLQPHELLIWAGPPGGGKTTSMQHSGLSAYMQHKIVLFVSLEVEGEQILRKFDTMLSNVRYHALKALELDVGEEKAWIKVLEQAEKDRLERDIIIRDDIKNCTVQKVNLETMRWKPNLVIVDYLEEMSTPRGIAGWEGVAQNGRGLKQSARVMKIPHITGTQINKDGDVAYQSALKIADMLIQLIPDEEMNARSEMKYLMLKYRDGASRKPVTMRWHLETGDIGEKGAIDRFPSRGRAKKPTKAERVKRDKYDVATAIHGKKNPWAKRDRGDEHKNPWRARTAR